MMDDQTSNAAAQGPHSLVGLHVGRPHAPNVSGIRGDASPYPSECVQELFEKQVRRDSNAVAVRHLYQAMTYGELNDRANRIAQHLRSLGVQPADLIGVCLPRCPDLVAALLGVW